MSTPLSPATDTPIHTPATLTLRPTNPQDCQQVVPSVDRRTTSIKAAHLQEKRLSTSQGIIGHSASDNQIAAQTLKSMLSQSTNSEDAVFLSSRDTTSKEPFVERGQDGYLQDVCDTVSQRMLRTAFERIYSDRMGGYRLSESGSHNKIALWKQLNNHVLGQRQPALSSRVSRQASLVAAHPYPSKEAPCGDASHPPTLLGERTGEPISRFQERGAGVIGNPVSLSSQLGMEVLQTDVGCDLPLYRGQELCLNLDSHLPYLAFEHPARIWNSIIHSLEPHTQPIIKWDYQRVPRGDDDAHTIARLTLIIPLHHPSLEHHPLRIAIPDTPYSREYIAVVDTLGGVKTWVGEARACKARVPVDGFLNAQVDAQNAALVTAMADGAIGWVLHPVIRAIPTDHDPEADFQALPMRDDTPESCWALLRQVFDHVIRPHPDHVWIETRTEDQMSLRLGIGEHIQEYRVYTTCPDDSDNIEAVCKLAIELNVVGFIKWLGRHC